METKNNIDSSKQGTSNSDKDVSNRNPEPQAKPQRAESLRRPSSIGMEDSEEEASTLEKERFGNEGSNRGDRL